MQEIISTREASNILGISTQAVTELLRKGIIDGYRLGKEWAVKSESVLEYKQVREDRGYQPGPKPKGSASG